MNPQVNGPIAQMVQAFALEHRQQVGGQVAGRRLRAVLPGFQKSVRDKVFGRHSVTHIRHGDPHEIRFVFRVDLLQPVGGGILGCAVHGGIASE